MHQDKIIASFAFVGVLLVSVLAYAVDSSAANPGPRQVIPTVSSVLPDPLPLDESHLPKIYTSSTITIFGAAPKAFQPRAKVWTCGTPRALQNDSVQTVKECEWK